MKLKNESSIANEKEGARVMEIYRACEVPVGYESSRINENTAGKTHGHFHSTRLEP